MNSVRSMGPRQLVLSTWCWSNISHDVCQTLLAGKFVAGAAHSSYGLLARAALLSFEEAGQIVVANQLE